MQANTFKWLYIINLIYAILLVVFSFTLLLYLYLDDYLIPTILVAVEFVVMFIAFFIILIGFKFLLNTLANFERINKTIFFYLGALFLIYLSIPIGYMSYFYWWGGAGLAITLILIAALVIIVMGVLLAVLELQIGSRLKTCEHNLFGLRKTIATSYVILGISNLLSWLTSVTIIASLIIYTFLPMFTTLLFYAAWKTQSGLIDKEFTFSKRPTIIVVSVAVLVYAIPIGLAGYEFSQRYDADMIDELLDDTIEEVIEEPENDNGIRPH